MCDYSGKLIAWLDGELDNREMANVQGHIGTCIECRKQLAAYKQVSATLDAYCDAVVAAKTRRNGLRLWVPVTSAAAAAIAAVLLLALMRPRVEPAAPPPWVQAPPPAIIQEKLPASAPSKLVHRQGPTARVPRETANWQPTERAIQISIPAESMFPPGAVPEGVNFIADLSIAADGSAEQMRLRPRLVGFERRQP